jgi:hypothetical protein
VDGVEGEKMTVEILIKKLQQYDPKMVVQIAKCGYLYNLEDIWAGSNVVIEVECKGCSGKGCNHADRRNAIWQG